MYTAFLYYTWRTGEDLSLDDRLGRRYCVILILTTGLGLVWEISSMNLIYFERPSLCNVTNYEFRQQ